MDISALLHHARLDLPTLARLSGVPLGYLKQLSAGNQGAGPETRRKLAAALREHRSALTRLAREMEP